MAPRRRAGARQARDHGLTPSLGSGRWTQTVAFIIAEQLINGVVKGPDFVTGAATHASSLVAGGFVAAVSGIAVVGISVLLFPVLKGTSEPTALAYVCERVVELVLQILFFLIVPVLLIQISRDLHAGTIDASLSPSLSAPFKGLLDVGVVVLYVVTSVGGTILGVLLYRSWLVPGWLAMLALVGYPMLLVGCVLDLFGATDVTQGVGLLAIAPGGVGKATAEGLAGWARTLRSPAGTASAPRRRLARSALPAAVGWTSSSLRAVQGVLEHIDVRGAGRDLLLHLVPPVPQVTLTASPRSRSPSC